MYEEGLRPLPSMQHTKLFDTIRRAADFTDHCVVGFSGGKDSIVTLDLCTQHFKRVDAFFMYLVPELGFQERFLTYVEKRYGIAILRVPHNSMSVLMNTGAYRSHTDVATSVPTVKVSDVWRVVLRHFEAKWLATGERRLESLERMAYIPKSGINPGSKRLYPICQWTDKQVWSYIRLRDLAMPPDYKEWGRSFSGLVNKRMLWGVKQRYPEDFEKIRAVYPYVDAAILHYEKYGTD
jgi:phosphoadenosine phosphosulfate reductase